MKNISIIKLAVFLGMILLVFTFLIPISNIFAGTLYFNVDFRPPHHNLPPGGLYQVDTTTGEATYLGENGSIWPTVGLAPSGNPSLLFGSAPWGLNETNTDGSGYTQISGIERGNVDIFYSGLAYDPINDILYGVAENPGSGAPPDETFFTIDPITGQKDQILASPGYHMDGLTYANGAVYGIYGYGNRNCCGYQAELWSYDIGLDNWSFVMDTGIVAPDGPHLGLHIDQIGLAYDSDLDIFYAIGGQDTYLYGIDYQGEEVWIIGNTGIQQGGGLAYVSSPEPIPSYSCVGFAPPCDNGTVRAKKNRALPLKAELFNADSYPITDLEIGDLPPLISVERSAGTPGAVDVTADALPVGHGTEGNEFVYEDGRWFRNLKINNYSSPGTYTITMESPDGSTYIIDPTCTATFVIE